MSVTTQKAIETVDQFMNGPLITWFKSCLDDSCQDITYKDVVDGVLLHKVFLLINPDPQDNNIRSSKNDAAIRLENLQTILSNIKHFYEEDMSHLILQLPEITELAENPDCNVKEAKLLLQLLLACAVQCANKELFITNASLQKLSQETQSAIVDCIKEVTECQHIVINHEMLTNANIVEASSQIKKLVQENCNYRERFQSYHSGLLNQNSIKKTELMIKESKQQALEIIDLKNKVKMLQDNLEEIEDELSKCNDELKQNKEMVDKYKQDNLELLLEAKSAKCYRDDLDIANEKAERAERLEREISKLKEKLNNYDELKVRFSEITKQNELLVENKETMQQEFNKKFAKINKQCEDYKIEVEALTSKLAEMQQSFQELYEEKVKLECLQKNPANKSLECSFNFDSDDSFYMEHSLSEQLTNISQTRELKLELENRRLSNLVDSLKENSLLESSTAVQDFEKDRKQLISQINKVSADLKKSREENSKLKKSLKNQKEVYDNQLKKIKGEVKAEKEHTNFWIADESNRSSTNKSFNNSVDNDCENRIVVLESQKSHSQIEKYKNEEVVRDKCIALDVAKKVIADLNKKLEKYELQNNMSSSFENSSAKVFKEKLDSSFKKDFTVTNNKLSSALKGIGFNFNSDENLTKELFVEEILKNSELSANIRDKLCPCKNYLHKDYNELKEDFTHLFSINKKLKEENFKNKQEINRLLNQHSQIQSELSNKNNKILTLDQEMQNLSHQYNAILRSNMSLENDKKSLMEHISQQAVKYHELIIQTLDDREIFHRQERENLEQINDLRRQKEKLEEKIMDHYKQLDSSPTKKKSFKSSFAKKVRKASSDLLNKSRRFSLLPTGAKKGHERCDDFEYAKTTDSEGFSHEESESQSSAKSIRYSDFSEKVSSKSLKSKVSVDSFDNIFPIIYDANEDEELSKNELEQSYENKTGNIFYNLKKNQLDKEFNTNNLNKSLEAVWREYGCA